MHRVGDIRVYKTALRQQCKQKRLEMPPEKKRQIDHDIYKRVLKLNQYRNCKTLLTYVSTPIEVDTRELIHDALQRGKRVAVPRCVPGTRNMEFYYIRSLQALKPGAFSVDEPDPESCELVTDFRGSICILPGLCFDINGYRIGYGKGYYDRFLCGYSGVTVGICYANCMKNKLITGRFDRRADIVITERSVIRTYI